MGGKRRSGISAASRSGGKGENAGLEIGWFRIEGGRRALQGDRAPPTRSGRELPVGRRTVNISAPLRLTDTQMQAVRRAAASLQPNQRSNFLQSIAHELADADPIDDEAVQRAVEAIIGAQICAHDTLEYSSEDITLVEPLDARAREHRTALKMRLKRQFPRN